MKKIIATMVVASIVSTPALATKNRKLSHSDVIKPYNAYNIVGIPVTTSPYLGVRTHFNASNMIVNISSIHENMRILQYRQDAEKVLDAHHSHYLDHPHVKLSGKLEGELSSVGSFTTARSSDVDLSGAELDFMIDLNRSITGYMAFKYDNSPFPVSVRTARTGHSRLFLDKGFVTIGNLNQSPVHVTFGQFYLPFGRYSSSMISAPLPMLIGRIKGRALELGYTQQDGKGFQGAAYIYRGDTLLGTVNKLNEGGLNLDYVYADKNSHAKFGVSVTSNLAEAEGMQISGGAFPGFSSSALFQTLRHRVPGVDLHVIAGTGPFSFIGEYLSATRAYHAADLSYLGRGAKPSAFNIEGGYSFAMGGKPSSVGLSFGHSKESSAMGLPKNRVAAALNTSLYRNTVQTLEVSHAVNYPTTVSMASNGATYTVAGGRTANTVIAKMGIYF